MTPRPRDAAASRAAILAAARVQFGRHGFDRTTIRSIAAAAGVDPALVMHYFGSKDALFAAASRLDVAFPDLTGVPPERVTYAVMPVFVVMWGPDGPLLPLLRAATSNPAAADALRAVFTEQVAPAIAAVARDRPQQRAALIGAHMIGIAVSRYVLHTPPLVDMDDAELADWIAPVVAHYLTTEHVR
jgi:AcrR family transcriptional regulator